MTDILAFENASIRYAGRAGAMDILQDVSFRIAPGETMGLVGESGCGKSTIALAAMRYLPQGMKVTGGRILVEGRDLAGLSEKDLTRIRGNRIAMVYQDAQSSLNPVMTIGKQLMEVPLLNGECSRGEAEARAIAMLKEVRLPDPGLMMKRYPHQLSGGQQQRVVIAMALMARPALLIMDEPTTGLDVTIEAAILELVRDLRQKFGTAILFISHNLGTVARICDRIGVLYAGRMVETGGIRPVFRAPAHPYTRGLLAALPKLEGDGRSERLAPIAGTLAASDRTRTACVFARRCAYMVPEQCVSHPIPLVPVADDAAHVARCVRLDAVAQAARAAPAPAPAVAKADAPVLLDVADLAKQYELGGRFGGAVKRVVRAVSDASFQARAGQTLAIVGESGSGKSTMAKIISGLVAASAGHARLGDADLARMPVDKRPRDLRRRIQMVFQNPDSTLNPSHSIAFALSRPLRLLRGLGRRAARREVARLLEQVQLPADLMNRMPMQLSGGQRQRIAIARALAGNPDLVVADEPVSALDVSVQAAILNLLSDLLDRARIGLVIISHDLALVRHMADWVAVMYLGRIVEYGPADRVFAPPYHPYTEALLAAAPRIDPDAGPPEIVLGGDMPSPTQEIVGCVFFSRCPRRIPGLCDAAMPPVRIFGLHRIACHLELTPNPDARPALAAAARH
ncbi:MAG: dipeptide ABC transporter ATP-binding protein [Pseudorhodoplanes sp.]